MERKMKKKFTVRLDEELSKLLSEIKNKHLYNLSALVRQALREKLVDFSSLDNSGKGRELEKDNVI